MSLTKTSQVLKLLKAANSVHMDKVTGAIVAPTEDKSSAYVFTSVQKLQMFLAIAMWSGSTQGDLLLKTGQDRGNGGKNITDLTKLDSAKKRGPGLVVSEIDPRDRKFRIISLTDEGKKVYQQLMDTMG